MNEILSGISEYFHEKGCYIHHFLEDITPHIKIRAHGTRGFVEGQIVNGKLRLMYQPKDYQPASLYKKISGVKVGRFTLATGYGAREYDLSDPDSLNRAFQYVRKHLFPKKLDLRGGLNKSSTSNKIEGSRTISYDDLYNGEGVPQSGGEYAATPAPL